MSNIFSDVLKVTTTVGFHIVRGVNKFWVDIHTENYFDLDKDEKQALLESLNKFVSRVKKELSEEQGGKR